MTHWTEPLPLLALACLSTAAVSVILVGVFLWLARRQGMLARPGPRQSHTIPTPTGGGLGMVIALCLTSLMFSLVFVGRWPVPVEWMFAVIPGLAWLAITGWLDDRRSLSPIFRLSIQLAVSLGLLLFLRGSEAAGPWPVLLAGGIVLVWIMNMYNFMDGSHGMAGFQGVFAGLASGILFLQGSGEALALPAFLVAGCCLGFLPWNFPVARVFMGDSGSVSIGYALGALLFLGVLQGHMILPVAVMILSVFLTDSTLTLFKRVIGGERWYTAHRNHVYQRLIAQGWPHSRVLLLYQAINIIIVLPAIVLATLYPEYAWPISGVLALVLVTGWYAASLRLEVRT